MHVCLLQSPHYSCSWTWLAAPRPCIGIPCPTEVGSGRQGRKGKQWSNCPVSKTVRGQWPSFSSLKSIGSFCQSPTLIWLQEGACEGESPLQIIVPSLQPQFPSSISTHFSGPWNDAEEDEGWGTAARTAHHTEPHVLLGFGYTEMPGTLHSSWLFSLSLWCGT